MYWKSKKSPDAKMSNKAWRLKTVAAVFVRSSNATTPAPCQSHGKGRQPDYTACIFYESPGLKIPDYKGSILSLKWVDPMSESMLLRFSCQNATQQSWITIRPCFIAPTAPSATGLLQSHKMQSATKHRLYRLSHCQRKLSEPWNHKLATACNTTCKSFS